MIIKKIVTKKLNILPHLAESNKLKAESRMWKAKNGKLCYGSQLSVLSFQLIAFIIMLSALVSCVSDDYVGNEDDLNGYPVAFTTSTGIASTRAGETTGADAAALLNYKFFVYGTKVDASNTTQPVFPGYEVDYESGTANTTTTNTADWEYVGKGTNQLIKYWDFGAKSYTFAAYSTGTGSATANATTTVEGSSLDKLELSGSADDLLKCYLTHKQTITPSSTSSHQVTMQFFNFSSKVRIGIYENLAGYSVKEVKFYLSDEEGTTSDVTPGLYASSPLTYDGGKYTIIYDSNGKVQSSVDFTGYTGTNNITFSALSGYKDKEASEEAGTVYLGRASNEATLTPYLKVLPQTNTTADLHLKVDYKLVSTDGKQTLNVEGVTAVVPSAYADWKPNYAYTYIFKINNTNPTLQPITFDAYGVAGDDGANQGTITTFGTYSITTHQKGDVDGDNVSYVTGENIEVTAILGDGSNSTKIALADVSKTTTTDYVVIYHQESPYETEIETATSTSNTPADGVYKETIDSYSGGMVTFNPDKTGTYRIEYWHRESSTATPECRAIKVVLVGDKTGTPSTNGAFTGDDLQNTDVGW